jgi:hypothetical protein
MKKEKEKSIPHTAWGTVCTPIKTDWHFVILMLSVGVLGIGVAFVAKHVGEIGERVDRLELESIGSKEIRQAKVTWKGKDE